MMHVVRMNLGEVADFVAQSHNQKSRIPSLPTHAGLRIPHITEEPKFICATQQGRVEGTDLLTELLIL